MSDAAKPGIETTEAMAGLGGAMSALTALFTSPTMWVQLAAIGAVTAIACTYIWSRAKVKAGGAA